ncbi:hypothetical protein IDF66_20595 [Gordonia hankookensis]|uniref:Mce-associated membrane protein n=1 Tax=Gordonia hankookensis TaxID=589403 RepID=A0ABR7WGT0_9ACTN|nr:hypothetical protein [Gordonia hankookensis]
MIVGGVIVALLAATCVFAGLWFSARSTISDSEARAADARRAEQIATDYAVGAATTDYRDLDTWFDKLKTDTSPQLTAKFDSTAPALKQILVPLNWVSTATPVTAKVSSENNGVYQVDAFVSVNSTSKQAPNGAKTTVTYNVRVNGNDDWKITDVGGLGGGLPN